jgi:hypothetical protein
MTLKLPDSNKHARIVHQLVGPVQRLQLRHVPSTWVLYSEDKGPDLAACVEALRRCAVRQGYVVDEGFEVEDWREVTGWLRLSNVSRRSAIVCARSVWHRCLTTWSIHRSTTACPRSTARWFSGSDATSLARGCCPHLLSRNGQVPSNRVWKAGGESARSLDGRLLLPT